MKSTVEKKLQEDVEFRERRFKDYGLVALLCDRYPTLKVITHDTLVAAIQDYTSLDRYWRMTLKDNPGLRGTDYDDKDKLEANAMENFGYNTPADIGPALAIPDIHQPPLL